MKKFLLFAAGLLMTLAACQKENISGGNVGGDTQIITVSIPSGMQTKSTLDDFGTGTNVNRCILQVYQGGQLYGEQKVAAVENKKATFELRLIASQTYDFVFWADKAEGTSPTDFADLHYTTSDLSAISVNGDYVGNNDEFDAFTATLQAYEVKGAFSENITLKRPFGQLNVKTLDIDDIPVEALKPNKVKVEFTAVPESFNALTGVVSTTTKPVSYEADAADAATGFMTVDYIWAPVEESVLADFAITFMNGDTEICRNDAFTNIPIRRNYRTNVSGNLLTKKGQFNVTIAPEFEEPDYNKELGKVPTVEDLTDALASGESDLTVTETPTGPAEVVIPNLPEDVTEISITLPATNFPVTFTYADGATATPKKVNVNIPESDNLVIDLPQSTVILNGNTYNEVTSTTAANTLIISEDVTVGKLTVKGGNVEIYGIVNEIVFEEGAGVVSSYVVRDIDTFNKAIELNGKAKCEKIVLADNIQLKDYILTLSGTLDLNGKKLIIDNKEKEDLKYSALVSEGKTLDVINGTVSTSLSAVTHASFMVAKNATLKFEDVVLESDAAGLSPENGGEGAKIEVRNSKLNVRTYGVTTNASKPFNCEIVLEHSTLTGSDPVLINVPCSLKMDDCTLTGTMHGLVMRGGTAEISNSTITFVYDDNDYAEMAGYFNDKNWGSGNMVNLAAMTIGNKLENSYQYPTNVTLKNTKLILGGLYGSHFPALYAHANEGKGLGVTLTYDKDCEFANEPEIGSANITVKVSL